MGVVYNIGVYIYIHGGIHNQGSYYVVFELLFTR